MARENIEAGSGLAQALAGFSKAVGDTRVQNAQNVSLGLQNMLNAMYRHRQDVKAEEQQRIDNNYREMAFAFDRSNKEKQLKLQEEQQRIDNNYREMAFAFDRSNKEKQLKLAEEQQKIAQNQWLLDYNLKKQEQKHKAALVQAKIKNINAITQPLEINNHLLKKEIDDYNLEQQKKQDKSKLDTNNATQIFLSNQSDTKSNTQDSQVSKTFMRANYEIQQKKKENQQKQQDSQVSKNPLLLAMSQAVVPAVTDGNKPNILFSSKGEVEQDLPPQNLSSPQNLAPQNQQTKKKTWGEFLLKRVQSGEPLSKQSQQDLAQYLAQNPTLNANVGTSNSNKETASMQDIESLFAASEQILRGIKDYSGIPAGIARLLDFITRGAWALSPQHQNWKNGSDAFINALTRIKYGNHLSDKKIENTEQNYAIHKRIGGMQNALGILMSALKEAIVKYETSAEFAELKRFPADSVKRQRYENAKKNLSYLESLLKANKLGKFDPRQVSYTPIAKVD